jgi:hypothetical protein
MVAEIERQPLRQDLEQQRAAHGGVHRAQAVGERPTFAAHVLVQAHLDARLQIDVAALVGTVHLADVGEQHAFATGADALARHVVKTQHHVLRGHDDRVAVGG